MNVDLRDLLDIAVGEPPHRVTAEAVRRTARRRAAIRYAASIAAVLVAGLGAVLAAGAIGSGRAPATGGHQHAGPPPYYLSQFWVQNDAVFAVRATASGAVTAVVRNPVPHTNCGGAIAAATNQTYFMTCDKWSGHGRTAALRETMIYRFHLTRSGRISGYSLVRGGVLKGVLADKIAAAPDGSEIAAEVLRPDASGKLYTNTIPVGVLVISTRTGHRALWRAGPYAPGAVQFANAASLSFTGDGRRLIVLEARCHRGPLLTRCGGHADMQVRAFSPAARGGSLERGRVLLRQSQLVPPSTFISGALISPDGSAVTAALAHCPRRGACTLSVARISADTGRVLQVIYQVRTGDHYHGYFERFFSSDPSGRYLILDAGVGSARVNGWIDHGRLVPLRPANGDSVTYETW
jgi:hypothetical protein